MYLILICSSQIAYRIPIVIHETTRPGSRVDAYRISGLWKADVYRNEEERRVKTTSQLSLADVAQHFNRDLEEKGADVRFDLDRIEDPGLVEAINEVYPEAVPNGKAVSIYDAA